jgi:hypothetical protein
MCWRTTLAVVVFPTDAKVKVVDLSQGAGAEEFETAVWTVGRYDERRSIYLTPLFETDGRGPRCIHIGIDLGGHVT